MSLSLGIGIKIHQRRSLYRMVTRGSREQLFREVLLSVRSCARNGEHSSLKPQGTDFQNESDQASCALLKNMARSSSTIREHNFGCQQLVLARPASRLLVLSGLWKAGDTPFFLPLPTSFLNWMTCPVIHAAH